MTPAARRPTAPSGSSLRASFGSARPELEFGAPCDDGAITINVLDRCENRLSGSRDGRVDVQGWRSLRAAAAVRAGAGVTVRTDPGRVPARTAASGPDRFYTCREFAALCLGRVAARYDLSQCLLLEPSAGGGAFYGQMPVNTVAFDVDPRHPGILEADFLALELRSGRRVITVGNPPFGTVASLAVGFFNHAARQSDVVAMIFPRSFLKASIENRLNRDFHLVHCEQVPPNAFELDGAKRDVAAVFQIWERRDVMRTARPAELSHPDFGFSGPADCDFVIRRVGANAGEISHDRDVHEDSHYFIKGKVEHIMRKLDLAGAAANATSTPSLAKSEIVALYRGHVEGRGTPGHRPTGR